jgi:hypothetical protein
MTRNNANIDSVQRFDDIEFSPREKSVRLT